MYELVNSRYVISETRAIDGASVKHFALFYRRRRFVIEGEG